MQSIVHLAQTLASFALVLGVLVSIHELGHYLAARWCGVHVEAFSLGFGPALWSWTDRRGTVWKISVLPLGGYVRMYGMTPQSRQDMEAAGENFRAQEAYAEKSVGARSLIAFAGPLANFVLAAILFAGLLAYEGRQVPLPVVRDVVPNSAAAQAGLQSGDRVLSVDGRALNTFEDLRAIVSAHPNQDLMLAIERHGQDLTVRVHIQSDGSGPNASGRLGVTAGAFRSERLGPLESIWGGITEVWLLLGKILAGIWALLTTGAGAQDLGGPIMIAHLSGEVAQLGLSRLINFIAMLSVNLGLVNLLPIPILDGGHLLFYGAEALRGRPVPLRAQEYGYRVGLAIIASIFVFDTWNDLVREGAFQWVAHLIG